MSKPQPQVADLGFANMNKQNDPEGIEQKKSAPILNVLMATVDVTLL
jgi:hypothetical protein